MDLPAVSSAIVWDTSVVRIAQAISTAVALAMLGACWRWPAVGRGLFVLLFAWAGPGNLHIVWSEPEAYLNYTRWAWLPWYRDFILGAFAQHTQLYVTVIALGQIAVAVLSAGWGRAVKLGLLGGMMFLLAITPLGPGAGFPFTLIAIAAAALLWRRPWPRSLPAEAWAALRRRA